MSLLSLRPSDSVPFVIAAVSPVMESLNASAALVLTALGILHVSRKLWREWKERKSKP